MLLVHVQLSAKLQVSTCAACITCVTKKAQYPMQAIYQHNILWKLFTMCGIKAVRGLCFMPCWGGWVSLAPHQAVWVTLTRTGSSCPFTGWLGSTASYWMGGVPYCVGHQPLNGSPTPFTKVCSHSAIIFAWDLERTLSSSRR